MKSKSQIHLLRVHLLAMARLSQRALDYSIKGYSQRHPDFSRRVHASDHEAEEHQQRLKDLCRELMNAGVSSESNARFVLAAVSIGNALHAAHSAAVGMAQDTVRLLESSGIQRCSALEAMGQNVNAAMRLCIVSLFERDAARAQAVLRQREQLRFRELNSVALHPHIDRWAGAQGDFERCIIRSLRDVAKQAHEMADALLFWMEGNSGAAVPVSNEQFVHTSSVRQQEAAGPLSYRSSERVPTQEMPQGCSY